MNRNDRDKIEIIIRYLPGGTARNCGQCLGVTDVPCEIPRCYVPRGS